VAAQPVLTVEAAAQVDLRQPQDSLLQHQQVTQSQLVLAVLVLHTRL
jgi:hypothetical protein